MLYLIGLGLNVDGISKYGLDVAKKCKRVYLENYTVEFPYSLKELSEVIGKKIIPLEREAVESLEFLDEAKKTDVALLVYGSPLTATTHISVLQEAKSSGIRAKVIYSASVLDAIAETGLQIYKFGKIASIPRHEAPSFLEIMKKNNKINAHTLLLIDIGMTLGEALEKLKDTKGKIILCQALGTRHQKIFYKEINELKDMEIKNPFCIIIPGKLHFLEEEFLKNYE